MTATETAETKMAMKEKTGYWRIMLLLLLGCNYAIVSINHTLPTFQGYTPYYFCQVDNVSATVEGCVKELNASIETDEPSCPQGYQFQSERDDWTIVTEWQLICERRAMRPLLATIYFCGVTLGAVICGMLADRYGRRPLILICLYLQGILGVSLYFASSLEVFMGIRFTQGFFVQGVQGVTFTLLVELFPPRLRTAVGVILELYWTVGLMYLAAASYYIPNWRYLQLAISIPTVFTLLYIWLVPESARWLMTRGRHREAQKVWDRILPRKKDKLLREMESIRKNLILNEMKCISSSNTNIQSETVVTKSGTKNVSHTNINSSEVNKCSAEENKSRVVMDKCKNDISQEEIASSRSSEVEDSVIQDEIASIDSVLENKPSGFIVVYDEAITAFDSSQNSARDSGVRDNFNASTHSIFNSSGNSNNRDVQNDEVQMHNVINEPVLVSNESNSQNESNKSSINIINNKYEEEATNELEKVISANETASGNNVSVQSVKVCGDSEVTLRRVSAFDKNNEIETTDNNNSEKTKIKKGFFELFKNRVLRKYNLIMVYVWFSVSLSYYGIMFYLPDLNGERHLNFLIGAILEAVSYTIAYFILQRFGRRRPMATYLLISGIICIVVGAASVVPEEDANWIGYTQTALALLGKAAVVSGFCTMFLYTSELFPTILRAAAMGHCGFWGRVGSLLAPQLLFLGEYTLSAVPLLIMGVLGMLAGLLVLALPETLGRQLPDTVEEAEVLANNK